jgi:hypothetical protein
VSFASLEERTNAAVMRRLSNARASIVGGSGDFPVIFERASVDTQTGASANLPLADALDIDVAGFVPHQTQLVIRGATYTVLDLQPDGTGMTKLVLEDA